MDDGRKRVVVGITGASGVVYGVKLTEALLELGYEPHVIITSSARLTASYELDGDLYSLIPKGALVYEEHDFDAPVSSGSFTTRGMVVAPCSMKTLAGVAYGFEESLVIRAALVHLKERRRVILLIRETPLNVIHIRNMLRVSIAGAIVMPASPGFYSKPKDVNDLVTQIVGRVLDLLGIDNDLVKRWAKGAS